MSRRKDLIARVEMMEKKLHHQRRNVLKHKAYFVNLFNKSEGLLLIPLALAFTWGWKRGRAFYLLELLGSLANFLVHISFKTIKQHLVQHLMLRLEK